MAYTGINKSTDFFNTKLYTGNAGTQSITGVGFQPDMVWLKKRSATGSHYITDAVRGVGKAIFPDANNAEYNYSDGVTAFGTDGWTVGNNGGMNGSSTTQVGWNWKAGTSFTNDASGTGIGTIDSAGSVNQDAGFSICSYTGTGSAGTIKHGLNSTPSMIITKVLTTTHNWGVYHNSLGNTDFLELNLTSAKDTSSGLWNNTTPTSSVFSIGTNTRVNQGSQNYISYCFAEKQGYSKFGSYTGNGNSGVNGPFINTGFKPAFVILKESTNAQSWMLYDNKRLGYNDGEKYFIANTDAAETINSDYHIDFLSNGIKILGNTNDINRNNGNYIYMCFGQSIVGSNNIPCTAR